MASQRQAAPATPRRSRRHLIQPLVQAAILGTQSSTDYTWASEPIGSRPATRDDLPVDDEEWNPERDPGTTTFYAAYVHDVSAQLAKIKRAKKAKGALPQNTTYRIGDTVLVHTVAKEASIAVITAMWAVAVPVRASSDDEESSEEGGPSSVKKMRDHMAVSLHWFTRPQELPRVRHKRAAAYVGRCSLAL
jgi:origin recognition complex subunit 1